MTELRFNRILVCGGRKFAKFPGHSATQELKDQYWKEKGFIYRTLDKHSFHTEPDEYGNFLCISTIINGAATGADQASSDYAIVNWCPYEEYPADWDKYKKSAGYIRNKEMLEKSRPDVVIAFPGTRGTQNMIDIANKAGVLVLDYREEYNRENQSS